jgi:hypothetical protein
MYPDFHDYFLRCMRLREYAVSKLLPYAKPKNPDFYKGLVPFQLDSESNGATYA